MKEAHRRPCRCSGRHWSPADVFVTEKRKPANAVMGGRIDSGRRRASDIYVCRPCYFEMRRQVWIVYSHSGAAAIVLC